MAPKKRTYSRRDKNPQEARRKRIKGEDNDELQWPDTSLYGHPQKSSALLKKGLKEPGSPTSIPNEDKTVTQRSKPHLSVFDKVLGGKLTSIKHEQQNIYGSREDFNNTINDQHAIKRRSGKQANSSLPTPPSELQKKQGLQLNRFLPGLNGAGAKLAVQAPPSALKPTVTSTTFAEILECTDAEQPHIARTNEADKSFVPRRDILGGHLSTKSMKARLWSINQKDSPFLRLPAEIRNQVYEYALGGNTIKIGFETYRSTYKRNEPNKLAPVFMYNCTVFSQLTNPFKDHKQPFVEISSGFTLLNSICRQLYLETATLPYKLNLISFASHNIMVNFLLIEQRISRQQRHAITQLGLPDNMPGANILAYLPNLKRVFLGVELSYEKPRGFYNVIRYHGEEPKLKHSNRY